MSIELDSKDIKVVIHTLVDVSKMSYKEALDMLIDEVQDWELESFVSNIVDKVSSIEE